MRGYRGLIIQKRCIKYYYNVFVLFFLGGNCTLASSQQLDNGRYTVSFVAFNPDQESLLSQPVEVEVFVGGDYCFVDITPNGYEETLKVDEVNATDPIVDFDAVSTCGGNTGDIVFNITSQELQPGKRLDKCL